MPQGDDIQGLARRLVEPLRGWFLGYGSGYEEGSWTPTFRGTTTAGTFTYALQSGEYVRVGSVVHFLGRVDISAITVAPVGDMIIGGLPFSSGASRPFAAVTLAVISRIDYRAGVLELSGRISPGENVVRLVEIYDNAAALPYPAASFTNTGTSITLSGLYLL